MDTANKTINTTLNNKRAHFIRNIIEEDLKSQKHTHIATRFPPHPNGYLHIGHAKAICLNFGLAEEYKQKQIDAICNLRFDDTNPEKERVDYINSIQNDINWLGFNWSGDLKYASDYFELFYNKAVLLIKKGLAYVCSLTPEQAREYRGTLTQPGKDSPDRNRSIESNLNLFERMKNGEFKDGEYTLRAKIDMASGNINFRDPMMYRIKHLEHHRSGNTWCIYPMYDFSHPLSDAIENITHSLCSLEFQDHRPLYNWFVEHCEMENTPRQIEFSRLNLSHTLTSKRKLNKLVESNSVSGWDDPRMPTISGYRRRGYTPRSIQNFCEEIGISKQDSVIDFNILEQSVRDDLDLNAERRMTVLNPLKITLTNYHPDNPDFIEMINISNHPKNPEMGRRDVPFGREIYIDQNDFMLDPPKKLFKLAPGKSIRLLNAYIIECEEVIKDNNGKIVELKCKYLPETLGGKKPEDGRKVKGFIHWVNQSTAIDIEVRLYQNLFTDENPGSLELDHILESINPDSLKIITAKAEPSIINSQPETRFQLNRVGYFCTDRYDHRPSEHTVLNLTAHLPKRF